MPDLFAPTRITFADKEACVREVLRKMRQGGVGEREEMVLEAVVEDYVKAAAIDASGRDKLR